MVRYAERTHPTKITQTLVGWASLPVSSQQNNHLLWDGHPCPSPQLIKITPNSPQQPSRYHLPKLPLPQH